VELIAAVQRAWKELPMEVINNTCLHFPKALRRV